MMYLDDGLGAQDVVAVPAQPSLVRAHQVPCSADSQFAGPQNGAAVDPLRFQPIKPGVVLSVHHRQSKRPGIGCGGFPGPGSDGLAQRMSSSSVPAGAPGGVPGSDSPAGDVAAGESSDYPQMLLNEPWKTRGCGVSAQRALVTLAPEAAASIWPIVEGGNQYTAVEQV